jgi:hypothetical protein
MGSKKQVNKYLMSPAEYIRIKYIRENTTGKIENGKLYTLWEGKWILDSDFKKMFPLPDQLFLRRDNPDKTKSYLLG